MWCDGAGLGARPVVGTDIELGTALSQMTCIKNGSRPTSERMPGNFEGGLTMMAPDSGRKTCKDSRSMFLRA